MDQSRGSLERGSSNENLILVCDTGYLNEFIFKDKGVAGENLNDFYMSALTAGVLPERENKNLNQLKEGLSLLGVDAKIYIQPSDSAIKEAEFFKKLGWQTCHHLENIKFPGKKILFFSKNEARTPEKCNHIDFQLNLGHRRSPIDIWEKIINSKKDIKSDLEWRKVDSIPDLVPTSKRGKITNRWDLEQMLEQTAKLNDIKDKYCESNGVESEVSYGVCTRSKPIEI